MIVGFVGLGKMGSPLATRLLDAGHDLVVFDVDASAIERLVALGARAVTSARAVGDQVTVVFVSLPTPAIVLETITGPEGIASGSAVECVVDLSTTGSETAARIHADLAERNVAAVDSPVSGGIAGASAGTLAVYVATDDDRLEQLRPLLEVFGRVFHVGRAAGQGQTVKLLNNYLSATALAATSEALVFGAKAGLDPDLMLEAINAGSGRNSATQDKFPRAVLTGTFDFGFALGLICKDLDLFAVQAGQLGAPFDLGERLLEVWHAALDDEGFAADFTTVVKPMERRAGVEVRKRSAALG